MGESLPPQINRWRISLGLLIPVLIVTCVGVLTKLFFTDDNQATPVSPEQRVESGGDYYIFVPLVELSERKADGSYWDGVDHSGPDPVVEIYWHGQRVFRSSVKEDALLAKWSAADVRLRDIALSGKSASVDDVTAAARISIEPQDKIELRVVDKDLFGFDDEAGRFEIATSDLKLGETLLQNPSTAIKRVEIRVVDMKSKPDLLQ